MLCTYLAPGAVVLVAQVRVWVTRSASANGRTVTTYFAFAFAIGLECITRFVPAVCIALVSLAKARAPEHACGRIHAHDSELCGPEWTRVLTACRHDEHEEGHEPTVVALLGAQGVCLMLVLRVGRRAE